MDADHLAHIVQGDPPGDSELELEPAIHRLACQHLVGNLGANANAPAIGGLLHGTRFLERNHDAGVKLFPHTWHGGEHRGRNLAHVLGNGLGVLHKVELGPGVQRVVLAAHAFGNMAQRQKAHALIALVLRHQRVVAMQGVDQALVQVHCALGPASGAGGVDQNGQVFGLAGSHPFLDGMGVLGKVVTAQGPKGVQADDAGVADVAQAVHVKHHDFAQIGQLPAHFQRLVKLLVIFHKQNGGAGILTQVMHL